MYGEELMVDGLVAIDVDSFVGLRRMSIVMEAPEGAIGSNSLHLVVVKCWFEHSD
jgi:hypothetical protein